MSTPPFHYAFLVRDLDATRAFYAGLLGCREGRSAPTWIDFDFFGHQISAHLGDPTLNPKNLGLVDGKQVPMPHFGAILDWSMFESLAARLRDAKTAFVLAPQVRFGGQPGEQATMFLLDPSGNALEFKAFRHPEQVFAT
jgi:extradiol dioxygenase family protein